MLLLSAKAPCCTTFFVACIQLAVSGNCPVCCSSWQLPYSFRRPRVSQPHLHLSAQHFVISHSHIFLSGISYSVDTLQTPIPQKMFNNNRQTRVNQHLLDAQQFPIPFLLFAPQSHVLILHQGKIILFSQLFQIPESSHTFYGKH